MVSLLSLLILDIRASAISSGYDRLRDYPELTDPVHHATEPLHPHRLELRRDDELIDDLPLALVQHAHE